MSHLVISPHMDDAVLSCYTLLAEPERLRELGAGIDADSSRATQVVNLFSGLPSRDALGSWDQWCRVRSSWAQMHRRIAEDYEILANIGVDAYYLNALDRQYRDDNDDVDPDPEDLARLIGGTVATEPDTYIWMPWARRADGDETHRDHALARSAGEMLADAVGIWRRYYYVDLPYLHEDPMDHGYEIGGDIDVVSVRASRSKLRASRAYKTQWKYLNTKWRQIRNERYVKSDTRCVEPQAK